MYISRRDCSGSSVDTPRLTSWRETEIPPFPRRGDHDGIAVGQPFLNEGRDGRGQRAVVVEQLDDVVGTHRL